MAPPKYKLSYFPVRALAEPTRLLFAFQGVEYEDERIPRENWPAIKATKPWGSMPVLEEDGKVLAQSNAILRYLGKKFNMMGLNDFEAAKCDEMIEAMADFKQKVFTIIMESDATKKAEAEVKLKNEVAPGFLSKWNEILTKNGTGYLVGNKISVADLQVASYLQIFSEVYDWLFADYPELKKHQTNVFSAEGIKEWVEKRPKTQW